MATIKQQAVNIGKTEIAQANKGVKMHVVAYFNAFDNNLDQFIVHGATTWKEALKDAYIQMLRNKNRDTDIEQVAQESIDSLPDDYEEACTEAFNQDWLFSVIEV